MRPRWTWWSRCAIWLLVSRARSGQGTPATAHWSYPDPSKAAGDVEQQREAFRQTLHALHQRLELLVQLPLSGVDRLVLQSEARRLGQKTP